MVASSGVGLGFLLVFDCCVCKFIVIGGGVVFSLHHWIVGGWCLQIWQICILDQISDVYFRCGWVVTHLTLTPIQAPLLDALQWCMCLSCLWRWVKADSLVPCSSLCHNVCLRKFRVCHIGFWVLVMLHESPRR